MRRSLGAAGSAVARQGQRFLHWMADNYRWVLPLAILVMLLPIMLGVILTISHVSTQQSQINEQQRIITRQQEVVQHIQTEQLNAAYANCERGNETRQVNISNLHNDVHTLKTTLALWEAAISTSGTGEATPEVVAAFNVYLEGLRTGIATKQKAIRSTIEAQAPVAIKPGSPVDDCEQVVGAPRPGGND